MFTTVSTGGGAVAGGLGAMLGAGGLAGGGGFGGVCTLLEAAELSAVVSLVAAVPEEIAEAVLPLLAVVAPGVHYPKIP